MPHVWSASEITIPRQDGSLIRALHVAPPNSRAGTILYFHGGGWAFGSHMTHEDPVRRLSLATGMTVISISYRLAPEHPFPSGLKDCVTAWRALSNGRIHGIAATPPLILAGDSAGANLALAVMLHEVDDARSLPDAAFLFYGVYNANFDTPSYLEWADGPVLTRAKMERFWDWYCPALKRGSFLASPFLAPTTLLRALPQLYIAAAEIDPLRSENEQFSDLMRNIAGRNDTLTLWPGLVHGALGYANRVEQVGEHIREVGEWANDQFPNDEFIGRSIPQIAPSQ